MGIQTETEKVSGSTTAIISLDLSAEEMVRVRQHLAEVFGLPEASLEELLIIVMDQALKEQGIKLSNIEVTARPEDE